MAYNNTFESYVSGRILSVMDVGETDSKRAINFYSGVVTKCSDSFNPTYKTEGIFGNADPLRTYTATERSIAVSLTLIAPTLTAARTNWNDISRLAQLVYPTYDKNEDGEYRMIARPMVKVKLMNLICDHSNRSHLPGYITNLSYDPNLVDGVYDGGREILPKYIEVGFTFLPEHTALLGSLEGDDSENEMSTFPYGFGAKSENKDETSDTTKNATEKAAEDAAALQALADTGIPLTEAEKNALENRKEIRDKSTVVPTQDDLQKEYNALPKGQPK